MPVIERIGKSKVVNHHLDVPYHVLKKKYSYSGKLAVAERERERVKPLKIR